MKKIEAIIRPTRLADIRERLINLGIHSMTITEVKGFGEEKGHTEFYRGEQYSIDFLPRLKLEIIVADEYVETCIGAIATKGRTGRVGDGRILIYDLEQVVNIRTGEAYND